MPYVLDGEPLAYGQDVVIDDMAYSHETLTIMSAGEREALGVTWVEPEPVVETLADRLQALADYRWQKSLTFTYDGVPNAPADSALSAVTGFVVAAQIVTPTGPTTWKLAAGEFRSWTFEQVVAYGIAIRGHIQSCFDREEALTALIVAAEDPASIDITTGWPS